MLIVRNAQLTSLQQVPEQRFIEQMSAHLRAAFPEDVSSIDEPTLRRHITRCIARARHHGLESRQDLCRFLGLCTAQGWDFDERPENDWVRAILRDPDITSPSARLKHLVRESLRRLDAEAHNRRARESFLRGSAPAAGRMEHRGG